MSTDAATSPEVSSPERVSTELVAVIVSLDSAGPMVLTAPGGTRLPAGPLRTDHRSLQTGARAWVEQQSDLHLGYVEQLYTFADPDRGDSGDRVISVSYLGLTRATSAASHWRGFYEFFPWEDQRGDGDQGRATIAQRLRRWARAGPGALAVQRAVRCAVTFGVEGRPWRPELALQRYELLYEAGLIPESPHSDGEPAVGVPMEHDHRRILATGIARLRAKIQYRPVVFELMPDAFTLGQLQGVVESLAGQGLHKQNFRRLITQQDLVEETGATDQRTGGRPAKLYAFRGDVVDERGVAGTTLPLTRSQ